MYNEIRKLLTLSSQTGMRKLQQYCIARLVTLIKGKTMPFPKGYHHNLYRMFRTPIYRDTICALRTGYAYIVPFFPVRKVYYPNILLSQFIQVEFS